MMCYERKLSSAFLTLATTYIRLGCLPPPGDMFAPKKSGSPSRPMSSLLHARCHEGGCGVLSWVFLTYFSCSPDLISWFISRVQPSQRYLFVPLSIHFQYCSFVRSGSVPWQAGHAYAIPCNGTDFIKLLSVTATLQRPLDDTRRGESLLHGCWKCRPGSVHDWLAPSPIYGRQKIPNHAADQARN